MPDGNIDMVINKLKDKNREYLEKTRQYDELYEEYSKSLQVRSQMGFEALHGKLSMYVWFVVTHHVNSY